MKALFEEVPKTVTAESENYNFIRTFDPDLENDLPEIQSQNIDWIKTSSGLMDGFIRHSKSENKDFEIFRLELESRGKNKLFFYALQNKDLIEGMINFEKSGKKSRA